jgi:hypothetical protein
MIVRRHARPVPLARINLGRLRANLRVAAPASWPRHLAQAFEILNKIDEQRARDLLIEAVGAADACARAIDSRVTACSREEARNKAEKALARLARCAGRAPAELRRRLDRMVKTVLSRGMCDAGDLQRLVHRTGQILRKIRNVATAATALRAMGFPDSPDQRAVVLVTHIEALHPAVRRRAEEAVSQLSREHHLSWNASHVFNVMAMALSTQHADNAASQISDLLVEYVRQVGEVWKAYGLKPSRARAPSDPKYTSYFHRFCELVLTALIDPWSLRHDENFDQIRQQIRASHLNLLPEWREPVSDSLPLRDHQWLVSDDHLKRARVQKTTAETP